MILKDFRYAVRTLLANRAVTLVAVACLSLGIGVNATMFSVVDGVLIKPFPFADPDRLLSVLAMNPPRGINQGLMS